MTKTGQTRGTQNRLYEAEARQLTVAAGGDVAVMNRLSPRKEAGFLSLLKILREADVAFVNMDGVITDNPGYPSHDTGVYLVQPAFAADELKWCGFNVVSCIGNHTMDYGPEGVLDTVRNMNRAGIVPAGSGRNLTEARSPAYLATARGRVAMISMCSYFSPWARATEQRRDCLGKPGLNPLRYETCYQVDAQALKDLKRISEMLGLEKQKVGKAHFGMFWGPVPDTETEFNFLTTDFVGTAYNKFVLSDKPGIDTKVLETDARGNIRWIEDARRQADWVLVSIHCHEADGEKDKPARFFPPFAKACIDAGADAVLGHGPHVLRGIEIYKGKPIFYSLGNFIQQLENVRFQPAEFYERYGLDPDAPLQEAWDSFTQKDTRGFAPEAPFWESVLASFTFQEGQLNQIKLYPITLGFGKPRSQRGLPLLAEPKLGRKIIDDMIRFSAPYGTRIEFRAGVGVVSL